MTSLFDWFVPLRTPLNAVIGYAEVLDFPESNTLTADQREYVRHILTVSRRIIKMMDGKIGFTSERGAGAEFWIDVPLVNVEKLSEASPGNG